MRCRSGPEFASTEPGCSWRSSCELLPSWSVSLRTRAGVLLANDPDPSAAQRRPGCHPRACGPASPPPAARQSGGGPPTCGREAYKQRTTVGRCINRLKQWRGPATRYDKTTTINPAGLHLAGIFTWSAR
ncbi:transposase [Streptomyces sp. GKU 257-1]|nr:transposase [Streptomyces sp. GKU 257-1]